MRWLWCADGEAAAHTAAELMARQLRGQPHSVLGLHTGSSAVPMFEHLGRMVNEGLISLRRTIAFSLDEFVGLPATNPASHRTFMRIHFEGRVDVRPENVRVPVGDAPDLGAECDAYEAAIAAGGGWDVAVVGLGGNGHIAFNEPGSAPDSRTRVVTLLGPTRQANASRFPAGREVPEHAITVGMGTILAARSIILVAVGAGKGMALGALLAGTIDPAVPVTFLRQHRDVIVVADLRLRPSDGPAGAPRLGRG